MKIRSDLTIMILFSLLMLPSTYAAPAEDEPSVSRRILVCEMWQWIGGSATTWGCSRQPREAYVAGGEATDRVVTSLQKKIRELEARLEKLEHP